MKRNLHLSIVILTLFFSQSCNLVTPSRTLSGEGHNSNNTDTSVEYLTVGGMKYLVVSTPQGAIVANVTKDSLEVIVRQRNEKYLELANRQFKKP